MIPDNWHAADTLAASARDRWGAGKPVANNTRLMDRGHSGRDTRSIIAVRLHGTDVVTFYPNGNIVLSMGGWDTVTTRTRINAALPMPWHVYSIRKRGESVPWLWSGRWPILPFENGLTITADGAIRLNGMRLMSVQDVDAAIAAASAAANARERKRTERIAAQHGRGAAGQYGSSQAYLSPEMNYHGLAEPTIDRDRSPYLGTWKPYKAPAYGIIMRNYHPVSQRGPLHDECARCSAIREQTIEKHAPGLWAMIDEATA